MRGNGEPSSRLMVSGRIGGDEIHRGMRVTDESGREIAYVAGVMVGGEEASVAALLLGSLPPDGDYRLAPVELVMSVDSNQVSLRLEAVSLERLSPHEPE